MMEITIENILSKREFLNFQESWDLAKYVTRVVDSSDGRKILIHLLDIWDKVNEETKPIWIDLIERAGFYPYYIDKIDTVNSEKASLQSLIRASFFKSNYLDGIYFHEQQKEIEIAISEGKNVAVSAPTSFGKSLLIEEIVARNQFDNILIIQPTLALIDETRRKMRKYADRYNLIVNAHQKIKERNIFILTAERVLEVIELPRIDFFVIDEFYKISNRRNDSRIDALNVALLRIMDMEPQAMFLTPTVDSLSKKFRNKYNVTFFKTDYALVNTKVEEIRTRYGNVYTGKEKKEKLFKLLKEQKEPSIVYVKSPNEAYKLANEYLKWAKPETIENNDLDIFEWIDENISSEWQLKKLLKNGIGTHNGALPRHVVTSEIELFNSRKIKVLFATVSLIEGVNTVAKNMFIYSANKGNNLIDFFDFANIRGRAGRMGKYFTGNVFVFNEELEPEKFVIDVPGVDQEEVSDEILVNIPEVDIENKERIKILKDGLDDEILKTIRDNLVSINGQKKLLNFIELHYQDLNYLRWRNIPSYDQLWRTLHLGYKFLYSTDKPKLSQNKAVTALKLVKDPLKKVISEQKEYLIEKGHKDPLDAAIHQILKFQRDDANFKIPKLLAVVESIQKYVLKKHDIVECGEYTSFAALLENDRVSERLQFLVDYGVPSSAIRKIETILPSDIESDVDVIRFIRDNKSSVEEKLINYEKNLVYKAIV
ncbi:Helicase conserved C-terminal domain protein [Ligilactobacillus salivarius cp400]|uniref:Helicase conserved C-terminal domain protein n=2 Tax=Ligilactobacillus salivarius TaxID=1624 RepID=V6DKU1_9LACO|nr:Helicase conserved C-terminal domain protein [Ligilactobacillus salivarius cp400]